MAQGAAGPREIGIADDRGGDLHAVRQPAAGGVGRSARRSGGGRGLGQLGAWSGEVQGEALHLDLLDLPDFFKETPQADFRAQLLQPEGGKRRVLSALGLDVLGENTRAGELQRCDGTFRGQRGPGLLRHKLPEILAPQIRIDRRFGHKVADHPEHYEDGDAPKCEAFPAARSGGGAASGGSGHGLHFCD